MQVEIIVEISKQEAKGRLWCIFGKSSWIFPQFTAITGYNGSSPNCAQGQGYICRAVMCEKDRDPDELLCH